MNTRSVTLTKVSYSELGHEERTGLYATMIIPSALIIDTVC